MNPLKEVVLPQSIAEIDHLNQEAWRINRTDPKRGVELANVALEAAGGLNYALGKAQACKSLGACKAWLGEYETSLEFSFEAQRLFSSLGEEKEVAVVLYNIFVVFYYLSDFENALKYLHDCYSISDNVNDIAGKANALNGMGTVYYSTGENEKAVEHLKEAYSIAKEIKDEQILAKVLDGLGTAYFNLGEYESAIKTKTEGLEFARKLNVKQVQSYTLDGIGMSWFKLGDFSKALPYLQDALTLRREMGFRAGEAEALLHIGELFLAQGQMESALCYLQDALQVSEAVDAKEVLYKTHWALSQWYERNGDVHQQIIHLKDHYRIKEDYFSVRQSLKQRSVEMQFRMEKMEKEKELLQNKNKELEAVYHDVILLSTLGQKITSSLSVEEINTTIYESLVTMMDAPSFGIGIYDEKKNHIIFPGYIEDGNLLHAEYDVNDLNRLAPVCFVQEKEILIRDLEQELHLHVPVKVAPKAGKHVTSLMYLPIKVQDKKIGVITVQSFQKNSYSEYHVNLLRNLAVYAGIALENARLYENLEAAVQERSAEVIRQKEEIERSYYNTQLLSEIGQQITSTLDLESIFRQLYENVNKLMPAECFGVRIYRPEANVIDYKFEVENGEVYPEVLSVSMDNDDNYSVWCVKNREVVFLNDNMNEYHKYTKKIVVPSGEMPHSLIFFPMMIEERVIGVITVQSFKKFAYQSYHVDILKTLGSYTAIALENANLYENMEAKVTERTSELVKQKEEVERMFENTHLLSEIGKEISSTLSVDEIITIVYNRINKLMDADAFGIGVYRKEENDLYHPCVMEKGQKLPPFSFDLSDTPRIATRCFFESREFIINDWNLEYKKYVEQDYTPVEGENPVSLIYIPLLSKGRTIGVMSVQSFSPNAYTVYHVDLIRNLAIHIGSALENANLYRDMEEKVIERTEEIRTAYENTRLLGEISREISSSLDMESILGKVHENVNQLMDAAGFGIFILEENGTIRVPGFIENGTRLPEVYIDINEERLVSWCIRNKKEIFISNYEVQYSEFLKGKISPVVGKDAMSIIYVPLFVQDRIIGAITVQSFSLNAYTEYQLDILRNLSVPVAIAMENAKLYQSMEDRVKERTMEVVLQKEEIEKNHRNTELLSKIGREITSSLSVESINQKVFDLLNTIMDAPSFGIGLYQEHNNTIVFPGYIEEGLSEEVVYNASDSGRLTCYCFNNEAEIVIKDFAAEIEQYVGPTLAPITGRAPVSVLYVPLKSKGKKIGVITAQSFEKNAYTEYHLNILKNLAVYVAIALENASLYEGLEEKVRERTEEIRTAYENTRLLSQIQKDISASLDIETIIGRVYENVNSLMDATCFGIGIYEEDKQRILMPGFIENGQRMEDFFYNVEDPNRLAVWCFRNRKEIFINNYMEEYVHYISGVQQPVSGKDSTSIIYIPLITKEKAVGVITVQTYAKNAYSEYHLDILRNLAASVAIALDNATLYLSMEDKVRERTAEVVKQKEVIEEKNKHITDSIVYAKRIQEAILPPEDVFKLHLQNSFVLYKPKDIVSGDFYWLEKKGNKILFAVVDCTGHGVPGAFMSIIGYNGLNQIVNEYGVTQPAEILNRLNKIISVTLKQRVDESKIRDGMDLSICSIDLDTNTLEYAGANNPIFIVRNNEVIEIKADKKPIGNFVGEDDFRFTNKELSLFPNDKLYLFSDGYADQFGGPHGKKLKYNTFRDLLLDNCHRPMEEQKYILDRMFEGWRGDLEQIDDVCVIGVGI